MKDEFSVDRTPKVVSWSPTIGTKVGYEDPPAQKRICGHADPTDHPDYGLLVAQANFRARNEAYTDFRAAWGANACADLKVVHKGIRLSTPKACPHFAKSVGLSKDADADELKFRDLKSSLKPVRQDALPCLKD